MNRVSSETEDVLRDAVPKTRQILGALLGFLKRKKLFVIAFVIIIAAGIGVYERYFNLTNAEKAQKELAAAMFSVSKHMILPEGDEPVLATVTDAEALIKQQAFFAGAVNGDQLLLFPRSLKAVIYSPSRNRIINAGPIEQQQASVESKSEAASPKAEANASAQSQSFQNTPSLSTDKLTVEIRNGTGKSGLAAQVAENIRAAGYVVVAVSDAKSKGYSKTVLATRTNDSAKSQLVVSLAAQIGAEFIEELPNGEKSTDADVLIILGGE